MAFRSASRLTTEKCRANGSAIRAGDEQRECNESVVAGFHMRETQSLDDEDVGCKQRKMRGVVVLIPLGSLTVE